MPSTSWFRPNENQAKTKEKKEVLNVHDGSRKNSDQTVYYQKKCQVCREDCKSVSACKFFREMSVNERWDLVKKLNLCKQCLKRHFHKCHSPVPCSEEVCNKKHHPLLHNICKDDSNSISDETIMSHQSFTSVRFRILPVILTHNGKEVKTYAFLDEGSSSTLLNEDIANQLELQGESEPLCLKWSRSISRQEKQSKRVQVNISGVYQNAPEFRIANIRTVKNLNLPIQSLDYLCLTKRYPHLKNLPVHSYCNARAGILIGLRNWHVAVPLKIKEAAEDAPIAAKCRLGWTIFSNVEARENIGSQFVENLHFCDCQPAADAETHQMVKEFFSVDSLGIAAPKDSKQTQEEDRAKCILTETTKHLENRYETGLLWRYEQFKLPDSRPMAVRRMMCLENRLKSDKGLKENIKQQIRDYEQKGYIRKLDNKELAEPQESIKKVLSGESRPTTRDVLRVLMSIYDPLGLIAHFLVYLKILLQNIWRSRIEWDDIIEDDQFNAWNKWLTVLPKVEELRIPRCILKQLPDWTGTLVQLHVFVDAGEQACATVAYLRLNHGDKVDCSLIGAKTKVAPIKLRSIPRLELDAAVMGCRFAKQISEELSTNITNVFFWSDSKTVLGWIRNDPHRYNKFVAFRVADIQDSNCSGVWRYIPSRQNVADDATKWIQPPKLDIKGRWFQGPSFLLLDEANWPKDIKTESETTEELLCKHLVVKPLIDLTRFSNWTKLLKTVAYVIRFLNIKVKMKPQLPTKGILSSDELKLAETVLLKIAQRDVYYNEYNYLMKQYEQKTDGLQPTVYRSSSIKCLSPYLDEEQLLRVRGRLDAATFIDTNVKRPVILPRKHPITHLIVQNYHEEFLHANQESVVNQLRQKYLIPKLRPLVKSVCQMCQWCKIRKANPRAPEMSPLPLARLSPYCEPFTFTGVDYFGPLIVVVGRRQEKRWGVIFTCLTIRAVHIEIDYKLDADSFILCFQDFIQRRGQPKEIYCDRGTNFIEAERLLRQELEAVDPSIIAKKFVSPSLKWRFNPPASPHMGGAWERLVRSFKIAMYSSLPTRMPTDPLLRSCLVSAENIINSRPLTYVPIKDDLAEALTPNHFLRLNSGGEKAIGQLNDHQKVLKFTYQYKERFANRCWERFIREYIPELTLRSKFYDPVPPLKIGDIVLIVDKDLPRNTYPKGRIIAVKTSSDGQVRSASVQTSSGILQRPSVKLALLEVSNESNGTTTSNPELLYRGEV